MTTAFISGLLFASSASLSCSDVKAIFQGNGDATLSCCGSTDLSSQMANVPSCDQSLGLAFPLAQIHLKGYTFHTDALPYAPDSISTAYRAQQRSQKIVRQVLGQTFCGLKAGLTALQTQQTFGVDVALFGEIACERIFASPANIPQSEFVAAPRYEAEITYVLSQNIDLKAAPFTIESVKPLIANVSGSFELVDFRSYGGVSTAMSFVNANMFYKNTVVGNALPWSEELQSKLDVLSVSVKEAGVEVKSGVASAVEPSLLGVVAQALNHAATYDIPLKTGDVIMTGSFIGVNVLKPDTLTEIDFGELGMLSVTSAS